MAQTRHIYGEVDNQTGLKRVFSAIRDDVSKAQLREELTELHKRAGYLITLTHAPSWLEKFGSDIDGLRETAQREFATTARRINQRAKAIGTEANYDENWGDEQNACKERTKALPLLRRNLRVALTRCTSRTT